MKTPCPAGLEYGNHPPGGVVQLRDGPALQCTCTPTEGDRTREQVMWERKIGESPVDALWAEVLAVRAARDAALAPAPPEPPKPRLTDAEFRALLDLLMVSDPWPLDDAAGKALATLADHEAEARGYDYWSVAYDEMPRGES